MPRFTTNHNKNNLNEILDFYNTRGVSNRNKYTSNKHYNNYQRTKYYGNRRKRQLRDRSPSPFSGTEEDLLRQIQKTSAMIKKKLMNIDSEEPIVPKVTQSEKVQIDETIDVNNCSESVQTAGPSCKNPVSYDVGEIQKKIITHITNLSHGKKMNLICAKSSGYDEAIQQIYKQKRLELSKALREMCSNQTVENTEMLNVIIPDIGIKIEDLPLEVIQQLSSTLDFTSDDLLSCDNSNIIIKNEPNEEYVNEIKEEVVDIVDEVKEETSFDSNYIPNNSISIDTQTDFNNFNTSSTQTEEIPHNSRLDINLNNIKNLDNAITAMLEIDKEILRLTDLRKSIFFNLQTKQKNEIEVNDNNETNTENLLHFQITNEKILVIKFIEDKMIIGSESGNIFYLNSLDVTNLKVFKLSEKPITSLCPWVTNHKKLHIMVGSYDGKIYEFDCEKKEVVRLTSMFGSVQCMEAAWNFIFVGTAYGNLIRYSLKQSRIEFVESISNNSIMVVKPTQEGARRVLLMGMKNEPVCIRDAMSGLHLRTMYHLMIPTVYSLVLENSLVYCGTQNQDILVFNFNDGSLIHRFDATKSKGICCLKIDRNLLFAGCYDGYIYVYNIKNHTYVGLIKGPGGVILSMELINNMVIVGTMSLQFKSLLIPNFILEHNH